MNTLFRAVEVFGADNQIEMIIEECSELILALQKYKRNKDNNRRDKLLNDIIDEIADVKVMLDQSEILFNKQAIAERYDFKVKRLENRIENLIRSRKIKECENSFDGICGWEREQLKTCHINDIDEVARRVMITSCKREEGRSGLI